MMSSCGLKGGFKIKGKKIWRVVVAAIIGVLLQFAYKLFDKIPKRQKFKSCMIEWYISVSMLQLELEQDFLFQFIQNINKKKNT